jgi:hypothetical protein
VHLVSEQNCRRFPLLLKLFLLSFELYVILPTRSCEHAAVLLLLGTAVVNNEHTGVG